MYSIYFYCVHILVYINDRTICCHTGPVLNKNAKFKCPKIMKIQFPPITAYKTFFLFIFDSAE